MYVDKINIFNLIAMYFLKYQDVEYHDSNTVCMDVILKQPRCYKY